MQNRGEILSFSYRTASVYTGVVSKSRPLYNKISDYGYACIRFNGPLRTAWHFCNAICVLIS